MASQVYAGQRIRAGDIPLLLVKQKAGTESVTSSTTMQNDDDLFLDLEPGLYWVWLIATATGISASAQDIKTTWTTTGTITIIGRGVLGPQEGTTDNSNTAMRHQALSGSSSPSFGMTTTATAINEWLLVECTVAGRLQLQWAQQTSNGTATTLSASSRLLCLPVVEA